ncbi:MAG: hypothetical protein A2Z83_08815 [Omnitrophica bacterium GWA2_52_8]|nr:MAG: hypothetical protein A2Z83_08815 [Omnitrophica bacterium GWA2_52_8]
MKGSLGITVTAFILHLLCFCLLGMALFAIVAAYRLRAMFSPETLLYLLKGYGIAGGMVFIFAVPVVHGLYRRKKWARVLAIFLSPFIFLSGILLGFFEVYVQLKVRFSELDGPYLVRLFGLYGFLILLGLWLGAYLSLPAVRKQFH